MKSNKYTKSIKKIDKHIREARKKGKNSVSIYLCDNDELRDTIVTMKNNNALTEHFEGYYFSIERNSCGIVDEIFVFW